jgi:hypothetical protein
LKVICFHEVPVCLGHRARKSRQASHAMLRAELPGSKFNLQ